MNIREMIRYMAVDQWVKILKNDNEHNCKHEVYYGTIHDICDPEVFKLRVSYLCSNEDDEIVIVVE